MAATHWLRSEFHNIPEELRPDLDSLPEFAAFFSTYLTSSFDVVYSTGGRWRSLAPRYCRCDICVRIINASHLRGKKLHKVDKRQANWLMVERLLCFGNERDWKIDESTAVAIVTAKETRRYAAYVAYGYWLIQRLEGKSDGPAILALWRLIAWDPRGGARRGFKLQLEDFKIAEDRILSAIYQA